MSAPKIDPNSPLRFLSKEELAPLNCAARPRKGSPGSSRDELKGIHVTDTFTEATDSYKFIRVKRTGVNTEKSPAPIPEGVYLPTGEELRINSELYPDTTRLLGEIKETAKKHDNLSAVLSVEHLMDVLKTLKTCGVPSVRVTITNSKESAKNETQYPVLFEGGKNKFVPGQKDHDVVGLIMPIRL